jgi:hypothetical protein
MILFRHGDYVLHSFATVLPFLLLLALWFFLMKRLQANKQPTVEELIGPIREMLLKDVGPEIRSLRESVDALRAEINASKEEVPR